MSSQPLNAAEALAMTQAGLSFLATGEAAELPTALQAEVLTGLEHAEARLTAARSAVLAGFCAGHGYEADGQFGPKPWLRAFTRITAGAATGALAWVRRLQAHPAVAAALATGAITTSWAREICTWTDRLPTDLIQDADAILLAAAAGGADLPDLALLATEMIERAAVPDGDDGGFSDRALWLEKTLAGAGRLTGDLTPGCAAALTAVLEALGSKTGPEDTRSLSQRHHDALEEACHRLIAANMVPGRDGQPLHLYAHADLARLATAGAVATASSRAESRWSLARTVAGPAAWCPTGPDLDAAACDATIIPVTTGYVDWALLDQLVSLALPPWALAHTPAAAARPRPAASTGPAIPGHSPGPAGPAGPAGTADPAGLHTPEARDRLRQLALQHALGLLSGSAGLAAQYRTRTLAHPFTGRSQPLDVGIPTPVIPPHLRRAVNLRDQHCRFPGCAQPPSLCQVHHLIPRAHDGPTSLSNLALLCRFHHLTVIHRWNWILTCHADGTATAVSPDGRTLYSHSPPGRAA